MPNSNSNIKHPWLSVSLLASGLIVSAVCSAQAANDMDACGDITDKEKRLECYDSVRARARQAPAVPPATAEVAKPTDEAVEPKKPASNRWQDKPKPQPFASQLKSTKKRGDGKMLFFLENEEVWLSESSLTFTEPKLNEEVKLKPGVFGAYFMIFKSGNTLRVSRVK